MNGASYDADCGCVHMLPHYQAGGVYQVAIQPCS